MYISRYLFDYRYRCTGFGSILNGWTVEFQSLRQDGEEWIRCCVLRELTPHFPQLLNPVTGPVYSLVDHIKYQAAGLHLQVHLTAQQCIQV